MPMIHRPERRKPLRYRLLGIPPGTAGRSNGTTSSATCSL